MGGAGGSLRAGVTENPVRLTMSVKDRLTRVTCGGAPAYVWPGGGITVMVDVARMPDRSTGYVPTPALVFPIEFTMRLEDYRLMGGHVKHIVPVEQVLGQERARPLCGASLADESAGGRRAMSAQASLLPGNRLHLNHGPIDLVITADGEAVEVRRAYQLAAAVFPNILPELVAVLPILKA